MYLKSLAIATLIRLPCRHFILALFSSLLFCSPVPSLATPLFPGADPDICADKGKYWIFPTNADGTKDNCFFAYSSTDLIDWHKSSNAILNLADISWANDDGASSHGLWAPGIFRQNNKWYLYFSVGPQNPTPSRIGVATCDKPDGVFIDIGRSIVTGSSGFEAIDPMVFRDPNSAKVYLYCGGSAGSTLHVYELNDDLVSIKRQVTVENPKNFTEGSFMHFYNGKYYLSYSHGNWQDDTYCVCYSTAGSPTGPWTYQGKILASDDHYMGPGHHAFFHNQSNDQWYIVYHRWPRSKVAGAPIASRIVSIDPMYYDKQGRIIPIKMSENDVAPVTFERRSSSR